MASPLRHRLSHLAEAAALGLLLVTATATPAAAGTVSVTEEKSRFTIEPKLVYEADRGEHNHLRLRVDAATIDGVLRRLAIVSDPAGVTAGAGCRPPDGGDPRVAVCDVTQLWSFKAFEARLGDRDDTMTVENPTVEHSSFRQTRLFGGPGDDVLRGDPVGENLMAGGQGRDTMVGGPGTEIFDEGDRSNGSDLIDGGTPLADPAYGQGDWVDYSGRRHGVHADLAGDRDDGEPGERDRIVNVGTLIGGKGADRLRGGNGNDRISGGPGPDVLTGGPGHDYLTAGWRRSRPVPPPRPTHDRLSGGSGDDILVASPGGDLLDGGPGADRLIGDHGRDRILAKDGRPDDVRCKGGRDRLRQDGLDFHVGCERHDRQAGAALPLMLFAETGKYGDRYLWVRLGCPGVAIARCTGSVRIEADGVVETSDFSAKAGDYTEFPVTVPDALWERVSAGDPGVRITVTTEGIDRKVRIGLSDLAAGTPGFYFPESVASSR